MTTPSLPEAALEAWRRSQPDPARAVELEDRLRRMTGLLIEDGWTREEAFTAAVRRVATSDPATADFGREAGMHLWPSLPTATTPDAVNESAPHDLAAFPPPSTPPADDDIEPPLRRYALPVALVLGLLVGIGVRLLMFYRSPDLLWQTPLLILTTAALYFGWAKRVPRWGADVVLPAAALIGGLLWWRGGHTTMELESVAIATAFGIAFMGLVVGWTHSRRHLFSPRGGIGFLRAGGETAVLAQLVVGGAAALVGALIMLLLTVAQGYPMTEVHTTLLVLTVSIAGFASIWVTETNATISKIVPMVARILSPLMAMVVATMLVLIVLMGGSWLHQVNPSSEVYRTLLMVSSFMLVAAYSVMVYLIISREEGLRMKFFDWVTVGLGVALTLLDLYVFIAMLTRTGADGFTPNRTVGLAIHGLMLIYLGGTLWHYLRFARARAPFVGLLTWQTRFLAVWAVWALLVAALYPVVF